MQQPSGAQEEVKGGDQVATASMKAVDRCDNPQSQGDVDNRRVKGNCIAVA